MSLASEIRAEMGRDRMKATELSDKTGISASSIKRKVFEESRRISTDELEDIAKALGVPAWELMRRAEESDVPAA